MARIEIKPLSVNAAYRGRRFATKELTKYKADLALLIPRMQVPDGKLRVRYVFGVSSKASDGDNLIKAFQDVLAELYGFNDKRIYEWHVKKVDVQKGQEFVEFELSTADGSLLPDGSL